MKKIYTLLIGMCAFTTLINAQVPEGFNYQAVVRDDSGQAISHQDVGIKISILQGGPEGVAVYEETFNAETNEFGLVNLAIGTGEIITGDFSQINWENMSYFVEVAMDAQGGSDYLSMGVSQLMSVPYALHSLSASNVFSGDYEDLQNAPDLSEYVTVESAQEGDLMLYINQSWTGLPAGEENQVLMMKDGAPQWSTVSFGDTDLLPPTVSITSTTGVTYEATTIHAEVSDDGGANVTDRGIVWGTSENPGFDDSQVQEGSGTGEFSVSLDNLDEETTYYIRAYAVNGVGTSFSTQVSVTTLGESDTTGVVTDVEGNIYNTVLINGKWWMTENLRVRQYNDGTNIPTGHNDNDWIELTEGAWTYFNEDHQWDETYGKLYNWYATADTRGLCPEGWRLPTDDDVKELRDMYGGYLEAGGYFKETGTAEDGDGLWREPNEGANNLTGFSARPGGARIHGVFFNRETTAYFWTGDDDLEDDDFARNFIMVYDTSSLLRQIVRKHYGLSVRCMMD